MSGEIQDNVGSDGEVAEKTLSVDGDDEGKQEQDGDEMKVSFCLLPLPP